MDKNTLIRKLSNRPFWDMDIKKLDFLLNKDFIIERVLVHGNENDEKLLYQIYGTETIKESIVNSLELNDSVISYLSLVLKLKKEDFKCYLKTPFHMNF